MYKMVKLKGHKPTDKICFDTSTWEKMNWFTMATAKQINQMTGFLLKLDEVKRVDTESERRNIILDDMTQIMDNLCRKIQQIDERFAGRLVPMGSAHNNMKMGDSDEFDFVYELEMSVKFLKKEASDFFPDDNRISIKVDDYRFKMPSKDYSLDLGLSIAYILDKAMSALELPTNWSHGGFNRPEYSGFRKGDPAFMLQFDYLGTADQAPLRVSVDFVPLVTVPLSVLKIKRMDVVNEFLIREGYLSQFWASFMVDSVMYYSQGEETWLREYSPDSVPKTVVRCCKALLSLVSQSAPKCPARSTVLKIVEYMKQKAEGNSRAELPDIPAASMLYDHVDEKLPTSIIDELVTYSDLGEAGDHFEYLKSYMFKRTVMTLMALDETKGHSWTEDDVPELVMTVFMIINDLLQPMQSSSPRGRQDEGQIVTERLSVPLAGLYKTTDQSTEADAVTEDSILSDQCTSESAKAKPPRFYSILASALKECKCMCLLELSAHLMREGMFIKSGSKYAGCLQVCQLLQNVCEGKDAAEIDVTKPKVNTSEQAHLKVYEKFMTKNEFEKMLPNTNTAKGGANKM